MRAILVSELVYLYYIDPGNTSNSKQSKVAKLAGLLDPEKGGKILRSVGKY
jgi:hypothetical protein